MNMICKDVIAHIAISSNTKLAEVCLQLKIASNNPREYLTSVMHEMIEKKEKNNAEKILIYKLDMLLDSGTRQHKPVACYLSTRLFAIEDSVPWLVNWLSTMQIIILVVSSAAMKKMCSITALKLNVRLLTDYKSQDELISIVNKRFRMLLVWLDIINDRRIEAINTHHLHIPMGYLYNFLSSFETRLIKLSPSTI